MRDWRSTWKKLRAMDRTELVDRGRQELDKRFDRILSGFGFDFAGKAIPLHTQSRGKFFFESKQIDFLVATLRQRLPKQADFIVGRADRICSHTFDLLGYENLNYGDPIDWHLDVVHRKRAPAKPFYRVNYLNFVEVGDSKITWELNRHQHLVTLAKAYRLNRKKRYADEILSQWRSWHAANPYGVGINWASSLEVAFRSLSWIWMYYLLEDTIALGEGFRQEWLRAQALNGRHLSRYLSTYFSPNTHLLGEGVALFFLGTLCSQIDGADDWKQQGWKIVVDAAHQQVNPDGMYFEQSTYYHVYALDFFLHAALLASANGEPLPKELEQTLERMMNALFLMGLAGPPAAFGDDDGGRLFDPARNRAEHFLDPLVAGAVLFNRGDFKSLAGGLREEAIWLLGTEGIDQWDRIEMEPAEIVSGALECAGIYTLAANGSLLTIDGGASVPQSFGHDHADALSICLQSGGAQLLIDPGTCEYVGDGSRRDQFRSTARHNTLRIDGRSQAEPDGPFSWKQKFCARAEQWITGESFDLFVGSHDAYTHLPSPVVHRRWVLALKSGIFLVRDCAEGHGEHQLDLSWHLAPNLQLKQEHLFRGKNSAAGLAVLPAQGHGWSEEVHKGPWSPAYGQERMTTVLNFGVVLPLPAEFATLLIPFPEFPVSLSEFKRLKQAGAAPVIGAYQYQTADADCHFFFGSKQKAWTFGRVESDAEFVCLTKNGTQQKPNVIVCNASYLSLDGIRLLQAARAVKRWESIEEHPRRTHCSEPEALIID